VTTKLSLDRNSAIPAPPKNAEASAQRGARGVAVLRGEVCGVADRDRRQA